MLNQATFKAMITYRRLRTPGYYVDLGGAHVQISQICAWRPTRHDHLQGAHISAGRSGVLR
jgi:hypothetical protein